MDFIQMDVMAFQPFSNLSMGWFLSGQYFVFRSCVTDSECAFAVSFLTASIHSSSELSSLVFLLCTLVYQSGNWVFTLSVLLTLNVASTIRRHPTFD